MIKKVYEYGTDRCQTYRKIFETVSNMKEYESLEFKLFDIEDKPIDVEKYHIKEVPTTIILDEDNELIFKLSGNIPLNDLTNIIDYLLKREEK